MKSLAHSEIRKWCRGNGIDVGAPGHPPTTPGVTRFRLPDDVGARLALSNALMEQLGERSVLVRILEWGVWPSIDRMDLFDAYCDARQFPHDLPTRPGFLFKSSEIGEATELVGICAMSLWDVQVYGSKGKPWLHLSHDEVGSASFPLPSPFEELRCD